MAKGAQSHRNSKPSISYKYNPHGGASFDLVDVANEDYAPSSHNNNTKPTNHAEARSSIVSTADVISGAGQLWKFATSSLPVLRHRPTSVQDTEIIQKRNTICYPAEEGSIIASISSEGQNVSVNLKSDSDVSPTEYLHKDYEPYSYGYLSRCMLTDNGKIFLSSNEKMVSRVRVSDELQYIYGWMNAMQLLRPTCNNDMTARNDVCYNESAENQESLCNENSQNTKSVIKTDHLLQEESQHEKEENCFDIKEGQKSQPLNQENSVVQINSPQSYKSKYGIAKQEHAFAGAFAGVFVSLCLHPMDTVKTVVQSCHADQRSIPYISKSIISERGLLGLYRGIASNIASSAPISAIYTFSYESVKAALLPLFAKEYHSLAHCAAGGCASVATSFVFTPSERIKQQMQISSHYRSCWNALMGIVKNGGFLSLYNGWGAVLCRNVPHSIIKFYTYESLKNVLLTSNEARGQPTTISTLLCGGLAGSTAALFTTPFDVVKTRLQTQIQGLVDAAKNYHTVLKENRKLYNEVQDLKGNIRVYCRIRPFLKGQSKKQTIIEYIGDNGELVVSNRSKIVKENHRAFKFNKVFGPAATQEEVFVDTQPLIRSVLDGYNVCIFAYGQTGSGKTYTMSGPNVSSQEAWGVNYRALNDLFRLSQIRRSSFDYEIGVQMVEIYNEQVRDLLSSDSTQKRLGIWNSTQPNGLTVPDASMHAVTSTTDVIELMNVGLMNRAVGATVLNERSSRSHSVLTVHVRGTDLETNTVLRGNLHLVDLAGSERVDRSEATGERLREAQHINKSLSALGDVIFALAQKSQHIPYRNSKLTQVLQSSLGGQAKTLMFVQLNPEVESFSETISTLKFAERVSGVELGAAHSNKEERGVRELMEQVTSLKDALTKKDEEIARLQQSETGSHQSADEFGNQKDFFEQSRLVKANGINDDIGLSRLMDADSESDIADGFRPIVPAKLPRPPQKTTPSSRTLMQTNLSLQRASLSKGPPHTASGSSVRKSTSGGVSFKSGAGW